jgi:quercetin dioxygenase-like cupin family protein
MFDKDNTQRGLIALGLIAGLGLSNAVLADGGAPTMKRTIIDKHDQTGVDGKEIVLGTAELPIGAASGWHTHPGDESGYVLKGTLLLKSKGHPDQLLHAGDHFFNPRGLVHNLIAAPSADGMEVSTWIVDKGVPLASSAPDVE